MKNWSLVNLAIFALLCFPVATADAACPSQPTMERYYIDPSRTNEITDRRTGLIWQRCSVGQYFSAVTCTGSPLRMTHEAALAYASHQREWRLPSIKELASIADLGCVSPAIDSSAFPGTLSIPYWSSTPVASNPSLAWVWIAIRGEADHEWGTRVAALPVRLVRTSP